jgi:hypothetical protein
VLWEKNGGVTVANRTDSIPQSGLKSQEDAALRVSEQIENSPGQDECRQNYPPFIQLPGINISH